MKQAAALLLALLAAFAPVRAAAHGRSVSYSTWTLRATGAHVELRLTALDATMLALDPWQDAAAIGAYATARLGLVAGTTACRAAAAPTIEHRDAWLVVAWDVVCPAPPSAIESRLFADVAPSHLHFARVGTARPGASLERVLTADAPRFPLGDRTAPAVGGSSFVDYVRLGVEHIRTGWDHLAFLAALLLLAGSLGEVASIVSAFTVAHSVTLALAALGVVRPDASAIEALIGFSIALVAIENAWLLGGRDRLVPVLVPAGLCLAAMVARAVPIGALLGLALFSACHLALLARSPRPARLRAVVAFAFGLVHGFGFAGVLGELDLPRARLVPALLGFNVGVELGQLAVVGAGWLVLLAIDRLGSDARRRVAELGSAVVCGLGLFWFVTRGWG